MSAIAEALAALKKSEKITWRVSDFQIMKTRYADNRRNKVNKGGEDYLGRTEEINK